MARNPVTAVVPVEPVVAARRVDSGSTYFRHLDQWRLISEFNAAERRAKEQKVHDEEFAKLLSNYSKP